MTHNVAHTIVEVRCGPDLQSQESTRTGVAIVFDAFRVDTNLFTRFLPARGADEIKVMGVDGRKAECGRAEMEKAKRQGFHTSLGNCTRKHSPRVASVNLHLESRARRVLS